MGFQSYAFRWFFGYSVGGGPLPPEPVLCPCPEYNVDATLNNQWVSDSCNTVGPSLPFTIPIFSLYKFGNQSLAYKTDQTLINQWGKRNCNG